MRLDPAATDPDSLAVRAAARAIGRRIMLISAIVVVLALAGSIAWVVHRSVPRERLEQAAEAGRGEAFVGAVDVIVGLLVVGALGVVFAGLVTVVVARRSVRPLGDSLRRQRRFVADASHELRTPLTVLDARLQALERRITATGAGTAPEVTGEVAQLRRDTRVLVDIVDDLLAAADTAHAADARVPASVDDAIDDVLTSMEVLAAEEGVTLVRIGTAGLHVAAPHASLRRCVLALVDNALAHAPRGSAVTLTTSIRSSAHAHAVVITVADRGRGIAGISPSQVFERFARAPVAAAGTAATARRGFGIGLALVHEIATRHGGSVRVPSTSTASKTMELVLPLAA